MTRKEFTRAMEEGLAEIPPALQEKISNVVILVEDGPSPGGRLLGLYEGIPHTSREHYGVGMTLPDRITLFRREIIEEAGGDPDRVREVIRDTVQHEIAHHFGMDEESVRLWEAKRKRR